MFKQNKKNSTQLKSKNYMKTIKNKTKWLRMSSTEIYKKTEK